MISIQNSVALINQNTFLANGNYESGLANILVESGFLLLEANSVKHLYCANECIASLSDSAALVRQNTIENIVGGSFKLTNSHAHFEAQTFK
jgi:hypothetical protein